MLLLLVQDAAARVVTGTNKLEHINLLLNNLHWLPVKFRINFKILLLSFKAYHGFAPSYLCYVIDKRQPAHSLRDFDDSLLEQNSRPMVTGLSVKQLD